MWTPLLYEEYQQAQTFKKPFMLGTVHKLFGL